MGATAQAVQGRILHVLATDARRGAETFAVGLAERLERLGWESDTMAITASGATDPLSVVVAGSGRLDPRGVVGLARAARRSDLVIAHGSSSLLVGALLHRLTRRPWVYRNIGDPAAWGQVRAADHRIGRPLRSADAVVSLYEDAAAVLRTAYGLDEQRQRVIPNAADANHFTPATAEERAVALAHLELDPALRWVVYVGALSAEKNPLLAIELVARRRGLGLLVVGDGPLRAQVGAAAEGMGDGRVRVAGTLADPSPAYKAADVLLMTSRTEGLPAVAIEASLSGLPVVSTPVGAVPAIVALAGAGECAAEPDLGEALDRALVSSAAVDRAAIVERYSWPAVVASWHDLLVSLGSERRDQR